MTEIKKPRRGICIAVFCALFLLQYGIEHAVYLLTDAVYSGEIYMIADVLNGIRAIAYYATVAIELLSLAAAAYLSLSIYIFCGIKSAAFLALGICASKLLYLFPHYYMTLFANGYSTDEALLFLAPISLFISLVFYLEIAAGVVLGMLPSLIRSRRSLADAKKLLSDSLTEAPIIDVGNVATAALSLISLISCLKHLVTTISDAVILLAERGASISGTDILSIVFELLFVVILMMLSHIMLYLLNRQIHKCTKASPTEESDNAEFDN